MLAGSSDSQHCAGADNSSEGWQNEVKSLVRKVSFQDKESNRVVCQWLEEANKSCDDTDNCGTSTRERYLQDHLNQVVDNISPLTSTERPMSEITTTPGEAGDKAMSVLNLIHEVISSRKITSARVQSWGELLLQVAPRCLRLQGGRHGQGISRLIGHWVKKKAITEATAQEWRDLMSAPRSSTGPGGGGGHAGQSPSPARKEIEHLGPAVFKLMLPLKKRRGMDMKGPEAPTTTADTVTAVASVITTSTSTSTSTAVPDFLVDGQTPSTPDSEQLKQRATGYMRDILDMALPVTKQPIAKAVLCSTSEATKAASSSKETKSGDISKSSHKIKTCEKLYDFSTISTAFYLLHRAFGFLLGLVPSGDVMSKDDVEVLVLACIHIAGKLEFRAVSTSRLLDSAQLYYNHKHSLTSATVATKRSLPPPMMPSKKKPRLTEPQTQALPVKQTGQASSDTDHMADDIDLDVMLSSLAASRDKNKVVERPKASTVPTTTDDAKLEDDGAVLGIAGIAGPLPSLFPMDGEDSDDEEDADKMEGKKRLYSRYNLRQYESFILEKVLGFWYFQIPVPVRVVVDWTCNGDLSVLVASRVLHFLDSQFYLRLPVDELLNQAWMLSERAHQHVAVTEKGIALASVLLVMSKVINESDSNAALVIDDLLVENYSSSCFPHMASSDTALQALYFLSALETRYCVENLNDVAPPEADVSNKATTQGWPYSAHIKRAQFIGRRLRSPDVWCMTPCDSSCPSDESTDFWENGNRAGNGERCQLIVSNFPKHVSDEEFWQLFSPLEGFLAVRRLSMSEVKVLFRSWTEANRAAQRMRGYNFKGFRQNKLSLRFLDNRTCVKPPPVSSAHSRERDEYYPRQKVWHDGREKDRHDRGAGVSDGSRFSERSKSDEMSCQLFVKGDFNQVQRQTLREFFERYGRVVDIHQPLPDIGFVTFATRVDAMSAIKGTHGLPGPGNSRRLIVELSNKSIVGGGSGKGRGKGGANDYNKNIGSRYGERGGGAEYDIGSGKDNVRHGRSDYDRRRGGEDLRGRERNRSSERWHGEYHPSSSRGDQRQSHMSTFSSNNGPKSNQFRGRVESSANVLVDSSRRDSRAGGGKRSRSRERKHSPARRHAHYEAVNGFAGAGSAGGAAGGGNVVVHDQQRLKRSRADSTEQAREDGEVEESYSHTGVVSGTIPLGGKTAGSVACTSGSSTSSSLISGNGKSDVLRPTESMICQASEVIAGEHTSETTNNDKPNGIVELSDEKFSSASTKDGSSASTKERSSASTKEGSSACTKEGSSASTKDGSSASTKERSSASTKEGSSACTKEGSSASTKDGSSASTKEGSSATSTGMTRGESSKDNPHKQPPVLAKSSPPSSSQPDEDQTITINNKNQRNHHSKKNTIQGHRHRRNQPQGTHDQQPGEGGETEPRRTQKQKRKWKRKGVKQQQQQQQELKQVQQEKVARLPSRLLAQALKN